MMWWWAMLPLILIVFLLVPAAQREYPYDYEQEMERAGWQRCGYVVDTYYQPGHPQTPSNIVVQMGETKTGAWKRTTWYGKTLYINPDAEGFKQWQEFPFPLRLTDGRKVFSTLQMRDLGVRNVTTCKGDTIITTPL